MNKNTAKSMQFIGRVGNASTKPSARGVSLLGWGEAEGPLSPEQQRDVLLRKVYSLAARRSQCDDSKERAAIGAEIAALNLQISAIKGGKKSCGPILEVYILDVIKEQTHRLTWDRWVTEARKRLDESQDKEPPP